MPVQATTMTIVQRRDRPTRPGAGWAGALNAAIQTASIGSMAAAGILADVVGIRTCSRSAAAIALVAALVAWMLFRGEPDAVPTDRRLTREVRNRNGAGLAAGAVARVPGTSEGQWLRQSPTVVPRRPITDR